MTRLPCRRPRTTPKEAPEGQALRVAAPGVLGNDTDPDSDALTAVEVTDPAHGEVFMRADGSFAYTSQTQATLGLTSSPTGPQTALRGATSPP